MPCSPRTNSSCVCDHRPTIDRTLTLVEIRHDQPLSFTSVRCDRRQLLRAAACGFGSLALQGMMSGLARAAAGPLAARAPHFAPRARRVIFLFMQGGPSQLDLFDPKPLITRKHGEKISPPIDGNKVTIGVDKYLALAPVAPIRPRGESGHDDLGPDAPPGERGRRSLPAAGRAHRQRGPCPGHAPAAHRRLDRRAAVDGLVVQLRPGDREREPAELHHDPPRQRRADLWRGLPARGPPGDAGECDGRQGSRDQVPGR